MALSNFCNVSIGCTFMSEESNIVFNEATGKIRLVAVLAENASERYLCILNASYGLIVTFFGGNVGTYFKGKENV